MLRKEYLFDIALPRLPSRVTLERVGQLEPRVSVLDEEFDEAALEVIPFVNVSFVCVHLCCTCVRTR